MTLTGLCVLCGGELGYFGREVWTRLNDGRRTLAGYACRGCIQQLTDVVDGRAAETAQEVAS